MKPKTTRPCAIVVTGTPGAGKTTVSKSLARQLHADYRSLTKLVIEKRLHAAVDHQRRTRVVDLDKTRAWLRESLRDSETVTIIDTHVPDVVPREYVRKVIVLRCHPNVLQGRLRRKGWEALKVRENVLAEILDSCYMAAVKYHGAEKTVQLDTSRTSVSKTVNQCKSVLKKHLPGKARVDWITVLDHQHALERYMK
jgi:adenylate kinase